MAVKEKRSEALVGLFLVIGVVLLGTLIVLYGNLQSLFVDRYPIELEFQDATGVIKGGDVLIGGATIGQVSATPYLTPDRRARVPLLIEKGVKLPKESIFQISSVSLLGDKAIVVTLPEELSGENIRADDLVQGGTASGLEAIQSDAVAIASDARILMSDAKTSLTKIDSTLDEFRVVTARLTQSIETINSGLLSPENIEGLQETIANLRDTSQVIKDSSGAIKPLLNEASQAMGDVRSATQQAEALFLTANEEIKGLQPALAEVPATMKSFRQTAEKASNTADKASAAIDSLTKNDGLIGSLTEGNSQVKEDASVFVSNLRQHGILGYRDAEASANKDPKTDRYRGRRR